MKSMTFMMQYLMSILSLESFKTNKKSQARIKKLESEIDELKKKNQELDQNIIDITTCVHQLADSFAYFASQVASMKHEAEDPFEALSSKADDKGPGYLH